MVSESNGWIIEPGSVESLARAMKQSIDADPAVIDEKRRNSLQRVRNQFVWNVVAERVEAAIIQSLKR
jgi:glycosyltransferase involved in cell wall biosynthesis